MSPYREKVPVCKPRAQLAEPSSNAQTRRLFACSTLNVYTSAQYVLWDYHCPYSWWKAPGRCMNAVLGGGRQRGEGLARMEGLVVQGQTRLRQWQTRQRRRRMQVCQKSGCQRRAGEKTGAREMARMASSNPGPQVVQTSYTGRSKQTLYQTNSVYPPSVWRLQPVC